MVDVRVVGGIRWDWGAMQMVVYCQVGCEGERERC